MLEPGDVLDDRYRLDSRIAAGGMGEVWQATDTVLGRTVAVKVLHPARGGEPEFQARFRHEARAMAALRHPGVADVYDFGETADSPYIVMTHIEGQPLDERIAEAGRLDAATTLSVVAQTARALDAAHTAGIIHRDVKPSNLITKPDGTVVLVDFGVAHSTNSTTITGVGEVVGTALYIAPEQVSKRRVGPATDIYALGAVAYHCLAGRPPFLGDNPVNVAMQHLKDDPPPLPTDVPAPLRDLVATALAKNPANRFPTAAAMAEAAESAATRLGTGERNGVPADAGSRPATESRRRRRFAVALGGLVLLALVALGVILRSAGPGAFIPGWPRPPGSPHIQPADSPGAGRNGGVTTPTGAPSTIGRSGPPGPAGSNPAGPGGPAPATGPIQPGNSPTAIPTANAEQTGSAGP